MNIKALFLGLCLTAFGVQINAQADNKQDKQDKMSEKVMKKAGPDIVDVAASNKDFSTLVAAVKAAGLVEALKANAKFTVFAPTNAAFDKLEAGTVETLLKPENKEQLQQILQNHVVVGEFKAKDIVAAIEKNGGNFAVETLAGGTLTASLDGDKVVLTDGKGRSINVVATDVSASNGVIHVLDAVCLPK